MTVEQFEQLPLDDGFRYELKDGELVKMANAKFRHEQTKSTILSLLIGYVLQRHTGRVCSEMSCALSDTRVYVPDVAFLSNELAAQADPEHIFRGAPDLAIEVVSTNESAEGLRGKIQDYLDAGSLAVWVFFPKTRLIAVYDRSGVREYRGDQLLEAPAILPGFQVRAAQFFES